VRVMGMLYRVGCRNNAERLDISAGYKDIVTFRSISLGSNIWDTDQDFTLSANVRSHGIGGSHHLPENLDWKLAWTRVSGLEGWGSSRKQFIASHFRSPQTPSIFDLTCCVHGRHGSQ
jgi:hypothetical protein